MACGAEDDLYLCTLGASSIATSTVARVDPVAVAAVAGSPTEAEILDCSIAAMRNGEDCEACQIPDDRVLVDSDQRPVTAFATTRRRK
jgi:hypothetical protein